MYIGKTESNLATRLSEHSDPLKSSNCKQYKNANFILNLKHILDNLNDINSSYADKPDMPRSFHNLI